MTNINLRDLKLRLRALLTPRRVERELDDELAFHVECETRKHIADGLSAADARARALARFGSVPLAADQCRDARGTSVVDATVRDVLYAFRTFRRAPLAALTIVGTVALGLGLVAVVFTFYNAFFLRADAVRNPGELFSIVRTPAPRARVWMKATRPDYEAMRLETSVLAGSFATVPSIATRVGGRAATGALVTGNFFELLGVSAARGRKLMPADDERSGGGAPVIVLSDRGWAKLSGRDPGVIGRTLQINGFDYQVAGVMPDDFRGLTVSPPDYWAPLSLAARFRPSYAGKEDEIEVEIVGRLKPGISPGAATASLTAWVSSRYPDRGDGRSFIKLTPRDGTLSMDVLAALKIFTPLFFAFGLILTIGCANVANLLLARGVARQREIGIRLSLGASRARIIRQLLTESLLLALASAACALAISRFFLETAVYLAVSTMPPEVAEQVRIVNAEADWRVVLFLVAGALASTIFFGLAPALQATRLELVRTMRGELTKDARPRRARHALIAVQVAASALLLICAAVFLRSTFALADSNPGVRTSDTVMVDIANEPRRGAIVQAAARDPLVAAVAASWPAAVGQADGVFVETGEARTRTVVGYKLVSPEYFNVLDIPVLQGRSFTPAERTADSGVAMVSETAARKLWPDGVAVGQVVRMEASSLNRKNPIPARTFSIIGVVRDVGGVMRILQVSDAVLYAPAGTETAATTLTLRVHGDPDQARLGLIERFGKVDPALGTITTVRTMARLETYVLKVAFWIAAVLGGLALLLTLSGLFSVLSYVVEQRRNEIGVRMALGATTGDVTGMVLRQSVAPVGFGLIAGGVIAAGLATVLMSRPAASLVGGIVRVFDPVAYASSLLIIVSACALAALVPALRAARIDPIATLRED